MFLLGVEFVLGSYATVRLLEKVKERKARKTQKTETETEVPTKPPPKLLTEDKNPDRHLHYLKVSGASFAFSLMTYLSPAFLIMAVPALTYSFIPYLRVVENSVVKKQKVDGYVLYGVADMMTLGLGFTAIASFALSLHHMAHFIISNSEKTSKENLLKIFDKQPNAVWLAKDGLEIETPLEQVRKDDIVVVETGHIVPVDGIVDDGIATVDQHMLTGESQPVEKVKGDFAFASTQVVSGRIYVKTNSSGNDTTVAKITEIINNAIDFKSHSQLRGEQWADSWNLPVLGLALCSMPFLGPVGTVAILNGHIAQSIRVVGPMSTLSYLNIALHKGILVKDGRVIEDLQSIDTFLFDKTGTLTSEEPKVGRVIIYHDGYSENDVLAYAAAAESKQSHPVARAILDKANALKLILPEIKESDYKLGYGISVTIDEKLVRIGSLRFMKMEGIELPADFHREMKLLHDAGHSLIALAIDQVLVGILEIHAAVRPEVSDIISTLRQTGEKHLAIISGDHRQPTQRLAETLGMDDYFYDVLPQEKAEIVEQLQQKGRKVCFIGDGVNDAIAMKKANISISLSGATSVATDTAQVVLMDASLRHLPEILDLSTKLNKNLNRSWLFNIVPGGFTIIGAYVFHFGIITSLFLNQGGLGLGILNGIIPLKKAKRADRDNSELDEQMTSK